MVILSIFAAIALLLVVHNLLGNPIFFLRWSVIRMALGMRRLVTEWQVGDGREEQCAEYVLKHAKAGDIGDVLRTIDEYAYKQKFLINVGDRKGEILDNMVRRLKPRRVMELGAYVGYSALRIARQLPEGGHLYSIEINPANVSIVRKIIAHAGATNLVTVINGSLGDGGKTVAELKTRMGFAPGNLDALFIDHDKSSYLPDLRLVLQEEWLHSGSVVVADNVKIPGAPKYKAYMESEEGKTWRTVVHNTFAEYQSLLTDIVLESTLL